MLIGEVILLFILKGIYSPDLSVESYGFFNSYKCGDVLC